MKDPRIIGSELIQSLSQSEFITEIPKCNQLHNDVQNTIITSPFFIRTFAGFYDIFNELFLLIFRKHSFDILVACCN